MSCTFCRVHRMDVPRWCVRRCAYKNPPRRMRCGMCHHRYYPAYAILGLGGDIGDLVSRTLVIALPAFPAAAAAAAVAAFAPAAAAAEATDFAPVAATAAAAAAALLLLSLFCHTPLLWCWLHLVLVRPLACPCLTSRPLFVTGIDQAQAAGPAAPSDPQLRPLP